MPVAAAYTLASWAMAVKAASNEVALSPPAAADGAVVAGATDGAVVAGATDGAVVAGATDGAVVAELLHPETTIAVAAAAAKIVARTLMDLTPAGLPGRSGASTGRQRRTHRPPCRWAAPVLSASSCR